MSMNTENIVNEDVIEVAEEFVADSGMNKNLIVAGVAMVGVAAGVALWKVTKPVRAKIKAKWDEKKNYTDATIIEPNTVKEENSNIIDVEVESK